MEASLTLTLTLTGDQAADENVDDAGDLLALMTPGKRRFDGEQWPDREPDDDEEEDVNVGLK